MQGSSRLGSLDIFLADVGIVVGSWVLREVSKIDPFEVRPEEMENQLRLDKKLIHFPYHCLCRPLALAESSILKLQNCRTIGTSAIRSSELYWQNLRSTQKTCCT